MRAVWRAHHYEYVFEGRAQHGMAPVDYVQHLFSVVASRLVQPAGPPTRARRPPPDPDLPPLPIPSQAPGGGGGEGEGPPGAEPARGAGEEGPEPRPPPPPFPFLFPFLFPIPAAAAGAPPNPEPPPWLPPPPPTLEAPPGDAPSLVVPAACLFALYLLFRCQPLRPPVRPRLSRRALQRLTEAAGTPGLHVDVAAVLAWMLAEGALVVGVRGGGCADVHRRISFIY